MLTRAAVIEKVKELAGVFEDWNTDSSVPRVRGANGQVRPALTWDLGQTGFEILQSLDDTECEQGALALMAKVDAFEQEWNRIWGKRREIMPEQDQTGGDRWPILWSDVLVEAQKPPMREVYSPQELKAMGCEAADIARRLCWYTAVGHRPDIVKVNDELANPGKHFDRSTFRDPNVERALGPAREAWERRVVRLKAAIADRPPPPRYDKRTAEEIAISAPGITPEQIAMRQGRKPEEVREELTRQGITLTAKGITYRDQEPARQTKVNCHDECESIDERIEVMSVVDGLSPGVIAAALSNHLGVTVTRQKVTTVIQNVGEAAGAIG